MQGEIKILFYIIVGIIYLVSTFYNKEKKKQGQRDVSKKPVDMKTAEDIFKELKKSILNSELPEPEPEAPKKAAYQKMERKPEISVNYESFMKTKKKPVENTFTEEPHFEHHMAAPITDMPEMTEVTSEINFEEIDPRKAFIYGEIFRRPQY